MICIIVIVLVIQRAERRLHSLRNHSYFSKNELVHTLENTAKNMETVKSELDS